MSTSINYFFKLAVDILEERKAPEWIINHPEIKSKKEVEKSFVNFGITSFRDKVKFKNNLNISFKDILFELYSVVQDIKKSLLEEMDEKNIQDYSLLELIDSYLQGILNMMDRDTINLVSDISVGKYKLRAGETVFKSYANIVKFLDKFSKQYNTFVPVVNIDKIPSIKEYNKLNLNGDFYVVFNSGNEGVWDVCTMSERGISSCQSWDNKHTELYNRALIGSILSKNLGLIYLTSGSQMERGEKMVRRCLIKLVLDEDTQEPYILLDKMYDSEDPEVLKIFKESLEKRSTAKVITVHDLKDINLMHPIDDNIENLSKIERPYEDTPLAKFKDKFKEDFKIKLYELKNSIRLYLKNGLYNFEIDDATGNVIDGIGEKLNNSVIEIEKYLSSVNDVKFSDKNSSNMILEDILELLQFKFKNVLKMYSSKVDSELLEFINKRLIILVKELAEDLKR